MTKDERDLLVARAIRDGRCPFDQLPPDTDMSHCPLGFPGCGCADELMLNPHLQEIA